MKRLVRSVVLAILIAVFLISCKTVDSSADLTDEQYDYGGLRSLSIDVIINARPLLG